MLLIKQVGSVVFFAGWLLVVSGCDSGGSATIAFDAQAAGQALVNQLDTNGDNQLSAEEMSALPALTDTFHLFDLEGNGEVSGEDAARRFQLWSDFPEGSKLVQCRVLLKGKPLKGASVRLVPEEFLGGSVPVATGTTDAQGMAELVSEDADTETNPGVRYGIYKVEISHPSKKIPTNKDIGQEVAPESRTTEKVEYHL